MVKRAKRKAERGHEPGAGVTSWNHTDGQGLGDSNFGHFSEQPMHYFAPDGSSVANAPSSTVDFMDLSLCNVLLSEGIPRAFI